MPQYRVASDKVRAIATFVCAMLLWPMAMVAAQGVTLEQMPTAKVGDRVVICTSTGLQTITLGAETTNAVTGKLCLLCVAGGCNTHHATVPEVVSFIPTYIPPLTSFIFTDFSAQHRATEQLVLSRAPPALS